MDEGRLLAVMATPVELPDVVARNRWPVHVTIVGNFRVEDAFEDAVADQLASVAKRTPAFSVRLGPRAQFGPERNIPVLLAEHPSFHDSHELLGREIQQHPGFAACEPSHWENGYRPHATLGAAVTVDEEDTLAIKWLTLASLKANGAIRIRAIELL